MTHTYFMGLVKDGNRLIIELADSVDQLSCETWKYIGERERTIAGLNRDKTLVLKHVNDEFGTAFERIAIRRIASRDFTARHKENFF